MAEQMPFGDVELARSSEPRCACMLLLDVSGSMAGQAMVQLNAGLETYHSELLGDRLASQRVEVSIITFGGTVQTVVPFVRADHFMIPPIAAEGETPMGQAILQGIESVAERKRQYRKFGLPIFRPWIILITDGAPTDDWKVAAAKVYEGEAAKSFAFFAIGVDDADFSILKQISKREPLRLKGHSFREFFLWLSESQKQVSRSKPGQEDQVGLPNPSGWTHL